jgi:transposase
VRVSNALQRENEELKAKLADRDAKIEDLARDLAALKDHINNLLAWRKRGHLIAEGQGVLFPDPPASESAHVEPKSAVQVDDDGDENGDDGEPATPPRSKKKQSRKVDTSALPREDRLHELPEEDRVCPETGQALVPVGEKTFDEIDYQRAQVTLIRHRQVIYGLPPEQAEQRQAAAITTPLPPRPLEGSAASATLLGWLLVQKYGNHLPLYRQEEIFARDGLRLPRQTLCDWVLGAAEALRPIADCLMARVRAGPVMQLDDTPVKCQGGRGEKNFQAYLWTFVNPEVNGVAYRFTSGRASDLIATELGSFAGWLVGDGYSGNKAASKKVEGDIKIGGCWAHVNRKFKDARSDAPGTAKLFRDDIKRLFEIEREADADDLTPQARSELRWRESLPVLRALRARARRLRDEFSDSDNIAKAIKYLHNQRRELRRFLEDGRIPIHNNACERAIRPIAVGRRNWLFAGSHRGGRAAAVVYTLIESCRMAKIDVIGYLADVLVRVATHPARRVEELLPSRWEKPVPAELRPQLALV